MLATLVTAMIKIVLIYNPTGISLYQWKGISKVHSTDGKLNLVGNFNYCACNKPISDELNKIQANNDILYKSHRASVCLPIVDDMDNGTDYAVWVQCKKMSCITSHS